MIRFIKYIIYNYRKIYLFPLWLPLFILSIPYRMIIILQRKKGYRNASLDIFLIGVGNITVGGTGKTEVVAYLTEFLKKWSKPAVILRGYKSEIKKPEIVKPRLNSSLTGDEALLLANRFPSVPVIIARKRIEGLPLVQKQKRDCAVLDDAFQHWNIRCDLNIVLIDYTDPFGNGHLIPAGILREPLSALRDADLILITKYEKTGTEEPLLQLEEKIRLYNSDSPLFVSHYGFSSVLHKGKPVPMKKVRNKRLLVLCGIGNPVYFFLMVKKHLSPVNCKMIQFTDHHKYTAKDIKTIKSKLKKNFDYVITTEKDNIKLKDLKFDPLVLKIGLKVPEEKKMLQIIQKRMKSK